MKKGTMQDFVDAMHSKKEYMDEYYNEQKIREALGEEPWNQEVVYKCYFNNRTVMEKILREHDGYKIFSALLEYKAFLNIAEKYYRSIFGTIGYSSGVISVCYGGKEIFEELNSVSTNINILFWGYATACQALMDAETELQKKHFKGDKKIEKLFISSFEEILGNNEAHYAVILLRNHLCHGMLTQFNCCYNNNNKKEEKLLCYMRKEKIAAIKIDHNTSKQRSIEKNIIGKNYLESNSDLTRLLADHYPPFKKFHETVYGIVKTHCIEKIAMCNSYFKVVYKLKHDGKVGWAMAMGRPAPKPYFPESDTYYLEYDMNGGGGTLSLGFSVPEANKQNEAVKGDTTAIPNVKSGEMYNGK